MKKFLLIVAFVLCCAQVQAQIYRVSPGHYSSIQQAIDDAENSDVIIVDPNTYLENINFLGKAITVRSTEPNNPDIVAATIIDGSEPDDPNYASVVTFNSGEGNQSVLTGFTITGGTGSWAQIYWQYKGHLWNRCGGGVLCLNGSSPTIKKNVFRDNLAGQGGGIYFYDQSDPVVTENTFIDNDAVKNHGFDDPDPDDPNIHDHGDGGAIVGFQYCDATITGNLIQNNHAYYYGGGIHLRQWSDGLVENNHIIGNDSILGAGIHITYTSCPTVRDNLIQANTAGSTGGGGIYVFGWSQPVIERNIITQNQSSGGAGIEVVSNSNPAIRNNLIFDNLGGSGIETKAGAAPEITNNTIIANMHGGVECWSNATSTIENNIITSNGDGYGIYLGPDANSVIRYNNVWDNPSGNYGPDIQDPTGTEGNISVDPQFVDPNSANYHLTIYSDCIDAGDNNCLPLQSMLDIDKEPRLFIFDANKAPLVDIGADEVVTSQADFNDDGAVDCCDFAVMSEEWLANGSTLRSDLAPDEFINFHDYALFTNEWAWKAPWHRPDRESALQFDSSWDGYVWIHTPEGCILNNVFTFTYTAWIYPLSFSHSSARIIGKNERAFMIGLGGTLAGYSHGGGTAYSASDVGSLQSGRWQFVMMTYDYYNGDKKVHLYVNSKEVNYQVHMVGTEQRPPLPDWRAEGEWDLMIGTEACTPGENIPNAIIDEVAIYDRVLTQDEINYLYNNGLGRPTPPLVLNPIGLWHLDEKQGTTTLDSSGNNNHGTLQGASKPLWTDGKFLKY